MVLGLTIHHQPQRGQPVLVEVEQQLDVLQEQQLEQLHEELHQDMFSMPTSFISTISKVESSRLWSSVLKSRDTIYSFRRGDSFLAATKIGSTRRTFASRN